MLYTQQSGQGGGNGRGGHDVLLLPFTRNAGTGTSCALFLRPVDAQVRLRSKDTIGGCDCAHPSDTWRDAG